MTIDEVALDMKRTREMIERHNARRALLPPPVYHEPRPEDIRAKVEPIGKAINRRMKRKV